MLAGLQLLESAVRVGRVEFSGVLTGHEAKVATTSARVQWALDRLIRGGDCGGRVRFNRGRSSAISRSGSVRRTRSSSRPSVAGTRTVQELERGQLLQDHAASVP